MIVASQLVFVRYMRLLTQVSHFNLPFKALFLNSWADAIAELVTFPFVVLRGALQPILPKKLAQGPPIRKIIHKWASPIENILSHPDTFLRNSGVLRPGEMVLVLGAPGSGCTTFLKVIANERNTYANVTGDVRYAGISHSEMLKYYNGEVVYNQEGKADNAL